MRFFTGTQAAKILGIPLTTLCHRARKIGSGKKLGATWMFTSADLSKLKEPRRLGRPKGRFRAKTG